MDALETYLRGCQQARGVGVPETSYYPYLKTLIDAAGENLKPRVCFVQHPTGRQGSMPDGGLFPANQLPKPGQQGLPFEVPAKWKPDRGVVEVKGLSQNLDDLLQSDQVRATSKPTAKCSPPTFVSSH